MQFRYVAIENWIIITFDLIGSQNEKQRKRTSFVKSHSSGQKFAQFHREIYRISNFSTWKKLRIAFFNHRSIPGIKSVIPQDNLHLPQNGEKQRKTLFPISP